MSFTVVVKSVVFFVESEIDVFAVDSVSLFSGVGSMIEVVEVSCVVYV